MKFLVLDLNKYAITITIHTAEQSAASPGSDGSSAGVLGAPLPSLSSPPPSLPATEHAKVDEGVGDSSPWPTPLPFSGTNPQYEALLREAKAAKLPPMVLERIADMIRTTLI